MKKKYLISLITVVILVFLTFFLTKKEEYNQTFAFASLVDPNHDTYVIKHLSIYSKKADKMIDINLTTDEKDKISELMNTVKVSSKTVKPTNPRIIFAEQKYLDGLGTQLHFSLFVDEKEDYYVFFHYPYDETQWYKLKDDQLPKYFSELLKK